MWQRSRARHDAVAFFKDDAELRRGAARRACAARPTSRAPWRGCRSDAAARAISPICAMASKRRARLRDKLKLDDPLKPSAGEVREPLSALIEGIADVSRLSDQLEQLLVAEPPFFARDGGFIAAGAHAPLDEVRSLRDESRRVIAGLEARYRSESGVPQLRDQAQWRARLFHRSDAAACRQAAGRCQPRSLPPSPDHRQRGALFDRRTGDAGQPHRAKRPNRRWRSKRELFDEMCARRCEHRASSLNAIAHALAVIDVAAALAELAVAARHVRPKIDDGLALPHRARPPSGGGSGARRRSRASFRAQ